MWNWGKNRSNVAASQGRPIASSRQKPGRGEGGSFSRAFGMSLALTAPWFQISILHNYERTKLRYLKLLSLWSFVMAILGNQYSHIYQPPWQMHPGIWLVLALWNASPCALCTVRPNNTNTKTSDLQQGKVYCKAKQGNKWIMPSVQFSSLSPVRLFATPWTAARQASLSITNSKSPPKPMSIESVMPSNHLILYRPLLLLPSIFPSIRVFSNESCLKNPKLPKSFQQSPFIGKVREGCG